MALATIMCAMDFSIANIAFPIMTKIFNTGITTVMWVGLMYTLASICFMLFLGKISDLIGRKKVYITGIILFTLGMIACSLSQNIGQLISFRMFQGAGAAMIISCGPAFITDSFPPEDLGKGIGMLSACVSAGFIIGPVLGGILLDYLDWRSIFYTRIPLGVITIFMAFIMLKQDEIEKQEVKFDFMGTLISSAGLFCLIFGVNQISRVGMNSFLVLFLIGLGIILILFFIFIERRVQDPILDFTLFRDNIFSFFSLSLFLFFTAVPVYVLIMPFYLMESAGFNPSVSGLLLAVTSVTSVAVSPLSGLLSDRFGAARFSVLGSGITIVSFYLMRSFDMHTRVTTIAFTLVLLGIGTAMFQTPNNSTIMMRVPKNRIGTTSALIATIRNVGLALGMALAGSVYATRKNGHMAEYKGQAVSADFASGMSISLSFQDTLTVSIMILFLVFIFTLAPKLMDLKPFRYKD